MDELLDEPAVLAVAALAREADPELRGRNPAVWLDRLAAERARLDAALGWCVENKRFALGLDIAAAVWPFWLNRGHLPEGAAWLARLLDAPGAEAPSLGRARALAGAGNLCFHQGDFAGSETRLLESLALFESLQNTQGIAEARGGLSRVAMSRGDAAGMREHSRLALEAARQSDYETGIAIALHHLAHASLIDGDLEAAERLYAGNVEAYRGMQRRDLVASELHNLGHVACLRGDPGRARGLFVESLLLADQTGGSAIRPYDLIGLGRVAAAQGQPGAAARLLGAGMAILLKEGKAVVPLLRSEVERVIAETQAALSAGMYVAAAAAGAGLSTEDALALVEGL
ncbi:MAG: hypothetical protein ABIQ99_08185 [Thermoflexales bacterium]